MLARLIGILLLVIVAVPPLMAQFGTGETENLRSLYQDFRYLEVIQEAEEILSQDSSISLNNKCEILRLLSLSYYTQQDMQGALKNFALILEINPNYRLDPVKNPPKILAFFEEIRLQTLARIPVHEKPDTDALTIPEKTMNMDSLEKTAHERMALSFFVPGSGQISRGEKTKGWILLGGNIVLLGSFLYFNFEANRLEDDYLQGTNPGDISAAYDEFSQAYQNRNLSLAGFLTIWLYTQIDFLYLSSPRSTPSQVSWYPTMDHKGKTSLTLTYQF